MTIDNNLNEEEILNKNKSIKEIMKNLFISKFDSVPIYDFIPLEGDKLKCSIKLKDITVCQFTTKRNKNIASKLLLQRGFIKLFPEIYKKIYKSSDTREINTDSNISIKDTKKTVESNANIVENQNLIKNEFPNAFQLKDELSVPINEISNDISRVVEDSKKVDEKIIEDPSPGNWNFEVSTKSADLSNSLKQEIIDKNNEFLKKKRKKTQLSSEMIDLSLEDSTPTGYEELALDDKNIVTEHLFELTYNPHSIVSSLFLHNKDIKLDEVFFSSNEEGSLPSNIRLSVPQLNIDALGSARNKHLAKQLASQNLLKKLFPRIKTWGELVNLHLSNKLKISEK